MEGPEIDTKDFVSAERLCQNTSNAFIANVSFPKLHTYCLQFICNHYIFVHLLLLKHLLASPTWKVLCHSSESVYHPYRGMIQIAGYV